MEPAKFQEVSVTPRSSDVGQRIDKFLGGHPEIKTRSRAEALIDAGFVTINSKTVKSSYKIQADDCILVKIPTQADPGELVPLELQLEILFEDSDLIVINKPAGLVVHPAAGHAQDTLVNALLHHSSDFKMKFNETRPGIVHRLDKDTSGILVVAKNDAAVEGLVSQFKARAVNRKYEAIVQNTSLAPMGTLQSYLARHVSDRKRYGSIRDERRQIVREPGKDFPNGKWAVTHYKVLTKKPNGFSRLELKLETGRTHQIRVHLSEIGAPVLADPIYGKPSGVPDVPRLALHAKQLGFLHPITQKPMSFEQDWPDDLKPVLKKLGLE